MQHNVGPFTIDQIKGFRGHEGETCLQGVILLNNKKVGEWSEDSWGGPHQFSFTNVKIEKDFNDEANKHPVAVAFENEMLEQFGIQQLNNSNHADLVVSTIAQELDLVKRKTAQLKRWCKTHIVVKELNGPEGEYIRYRLRSRSYDPAKDDQVMLVKHPGCEIINKRFA